MNSAEKLFALYGIDAVSTREIVADAGLKNVNSLTYHFSTKENLVREVLITGAIEAENCRRFWLNRLYETSSQLSVRNAIKVLAAPTIHRAVTPSYAMLAVQLALTQREFFLEIIGPQMVVTLDICHRAIQSAVKSIKPNIVEERLKLFQIYLIQFLPSRDIKMRAGEDDGSWASPHMVEHFLDTAEAMLTSPPSKSAIAAQREYEAQKDRYRGPVVPDNIRYSLFDAIATHETASPLPRRR